MYMYMYLSIINLILCSPCFCSLALQRLILTISKLTLNVEELLLLKFLQFLGLSQPDVTMETLEESHYDTSR